MIFRIIPSKAGKMAGISVDLMVGKLIDIKKVFQRLDPYRMAKELEPGMRTTMRQVVNNAALFEMPSVWNTLPDEIKNDLYAKLLLTLPDFFQNLLHDVQENIFDVFDIRDFAVRKMTIDKSLTNNVFLNVGAKEFRFIEYSGFVFGFLFGCIQTVVYLFYTRDIVLPIAGLIVGYATNWLALKMIFEPVEPIYFCGYKIQGLFLKRQKEVAVEFAKITSELIFTSEAMWDEILYGPLAPKFEEYVRRHSKKITKNLMDGMEKELKMYLTPHCMECIQDRIADNIIAEIPNTIHLGYEYSKEALGIEREIREKLGDLPSKEFEGVLHPVFQEDELKLILVGAALGAGVGALQLLIPNGSN